VGVNQLECEADRFPQCSPEVMNSGARTLNPPYCDMHAQCQ
jgi:hypothetical protein